MARVILPRVDRVATITSRTECFLGARFEELNVLFYELKLSRQPTMALYDLIPAPRRRRQVSASLSSKPARAT